MFLFNLHEGVVGLLSSYPTAFSSGLDRDRMAKLVSSLRTLLVRLFLSSDKFTAKDVEGRIKVFFPILPRRPSNDNDWENWSQLLHLPAEELTSASKRNKISASYFNRKLANLAHERRMDPIDIVLQIWTEVEPKLKELEKYASALLPTSYLDMLWASQHPKVQMMVSRFGSAQDENTLLDFFLYLCNLRVESEFYSSRFIQRKLGIDEEFII